MREKMTKKTVEEINERKLRSEIKLKDEQTKSEFRREEGVRKKWINRKGGR